MTSCLMEKDSDKGERIVVVVVHILLQLVRYKDRPPSFPGSALVGQVAVGRKTPRVLIAVFLLLRLLRLLHHHSLLMALYMAMSMRADMTKSLVSLERKVFSTVASLG